VRRPEARSAGIDRPDGVTLAFQVSANMVEPSKCTLARNLLAKDSDRAAEADKLEPDGPKMSIVFEAFVRAGCAEWLAWAAPGPDGAIVGPSCGSENMTPYANPCEEVALVESAQVAVVNVNDAALIHFSWCDMPRRD